MLIPDSLKEKLGRHTHVIFATTEGSQPRMRTMTLINDEQGLFFATDAGTEKMAQLEANPRAEFLIQLKEGDNNGYIRCECVAEVVENRRLRARLFSENAFIGKLWKGPEDPALAILRLKAKAYYLLEPGKWAVATINVEPGTE